MTNETIKKLRALTIEPTPPGIADWQWLILRVELILLVAGYKKATMVAFEAGTPTTAIAALSAKVTQFQLDSVIGNESVNDIQPLYIGTSGAHLLEIQQVFSGELSAAEADRLHGRLSGFPETAIEAFVDGSVLALSALPEATRQEARYTFAPFRLSPDHWQTELETGATWAQITKQVSPELYNQYLARFTGLS